MTIDALERRCLFVASFDVAHLTDLRDDPQYVDVDGSGVAIAVLDSGIFATNPDLQSNVVGWYNAVADPVETPLTTTPVNDAFDLQGHGTHVAGIAASTNPDIGVAYASKIVSVKVLPDPGESQLSGNPLVRGLQWVKLHSNDLGIRVVNLSLGTGENYNTVTSSLANGDIARAIDDLEEIGITVVASSGNSYAQYLAPGASLPAVVSTISVANSWAGTGRSEDFNSGRGGSGDRYQAIEKSGAPDRIAAASQRSTLANQLVAPGQDIFSTWNGIAGDDGGDGLHKYQSGTSMSAPFVSGVVALMQDAAKTFGGRYFFDPNQILQILQSTADSITDSNVADNNRYDTVTGDLTNLPETSLTYKRINVFKAIQSVVALVTAGNPNVPPPVGGGQADTDSTRSRATLVPSLDGNQQFGYTGKIGTDGQVAVGNGDIDLYRINLQARGSVQVDLTLPTGGTAGLPATLRLFNAAGAEIARADGSAGTFPVLATDPNAPLTIGNYYIGISALPNASYDIVNGTGVVAGSAGGDYHLSVSLTNPDPDGIVTGATTVNLGDPKESKIDPNGSGRTITFNRNKGILGSDVPKFGSATRVAVDADVDMYRFVAPDSGKLNVRTESQILYGSNGADTYIKVYGQNLQLIGENDDFNSSSIDSGLTFNITRGEVYYVAVTVFGNHTFDAADPYASRTAGSTPTDRPYDLISWVDNGDTNGTVLSASTLTAGTSVNGAIGQDGTSTVGGSLLPNKDVDWYRLTVPSDGVLTFDLATTAGAQPVLSLWSVDTAKRQTTRIDEASLGVTSADTTLALPVTAGQVLYAALVGPGNSSFNAFAVASGSGGSTGGYSLTTTLQPTSVLKTLTNNSLQTGTPTPIALDQMINAAIGRDDALLLGADDVDLYSFTPAADIGVRFRTVAASEEDADTVLRLFDSTGKELAANDNAAAAGKASRIAEFLKAGQTYYIGVSGAGDAATSYDPVTGANAGDGSTGRYSLVVEQLPPGSASLTFGGDTIGNYTDPDGNAITLQIIGPGIGQLEVDSSDPDSFQLNVSGTTDKTIFRITGNSTFGATHIEGPLKFLEADGINFRGALVIDGDVKTVTIASSAAGSSLSAGAVQLLRTAGDFGSDVSLAGLGQALFGGNLTSGTWQVGGDVRKLIAADAAAGLNATFTGTVRLVKLNALSGQLTAGAFRNVRIAGAMTGSVRTTSGQVVSLSAASMENASVRSAADIGKIVVGSSTGSLVFAGISDSLDSLPSSGDDFASDAAVRSFTVKAGPFSDSVVAASNLRKVKLATVNNANNGTTFGLAAKKFGIVTAAGKRLTKPGSGPVVGGSQDDFQIRQIT